MNLPYQNNEIIKELKQTARQSKTPLYGAFELTSRCNLDCKMCFVHTQNSIELKRQELSTEQWINIIDSACNSGMLFALLTGGECLLRDDFEDIYMHLTRKGVIVSVNTNAVLISEKHIDLFTKNRPERIQFSIYGSNDDGYYNVTGHRVFARFQESIRELKAAGLNIEAAVTPSSYMLNDIEGVLSFLEKENIKYTISNILIEPRTSNANADACKMSIEDRLYISKIKAKLTNRTVSSPNSPPPVPGGSVTNVNYGMPCNAGTIRFCIDWKGNMIPCLSIPEISISTQKNSFAECWNYITSKMEEVKQPVECSGCPYESKCILCPVARYDGLFSGHCNKSVCELMQKKFEAGLLSL